MEQSNQSNPDIESDAEYKLKGQKGLRDRESEMSKRGKLSIIIVISRQINETDWWFSRHANKLNAQVKNKIVYHSIYLVKKLKYRRRVINKQRAKVSGMCDIPNSSYSAKGFTVKSVGLRMETPCWSPSEGKPVETSGVYFSSLKTFILSVKLENICIGISLNILVTQNSKT